MDPLSDILGSLRFESSILCRAKLGAPWGLYTRGASSAVFHAILEGACWVKHPPDGAARRLSRGDLVLVSHGDAHVMCDSPDTVPVPIASLLEGRPGGPMSCIAHGGDGTPCSILCGTFRLEHGAANELLSLLPPLVIVSRGETSTVEWFDTTVALIARELAAGQSGVETIVSRLTDVLVVQVLRAAATSLPSEAAGWLAAVQNEQIGRALALVHRRPDEKWSAESLASAVGMSRSVFFDKFTKLVGESPVQYLTRWRMYTAADLLKHGDLSNAELADRVGYGSEDAFAKVFKKHLGVTPGEFKRRARA